MCINDTQGHLLGEYQADNKPVQEIIWLGDTPVAVVSTTGASANISYIWADHLGTPRQITDPASKQILWRWDGEAFDNSLADEDPSNTGKKFSYSLRFPGQYFDKETGKHYNYFRDYDPATGRYIQSDPIGLAGGINTYAYVGGNPLSYSDPSGLFVPALAIPVCAAGGCEAAVTAIITVGGAILSEIALQSIKPPRVNDPEAAAEHDAYKQPPPPDLDPCEKLKWQLAREKALLAARIAWDAKWGAHHEAANIQSLNAIKNLETKIKNTKGCTCP